MPRDNEFQYTDSEFNKLDILIYSSGETVVTVDDKSVLLTTRKAHDLRDLLNRRFRPNPFGATFTVAGRGDFPVDMLRRSECHPVDGDSAARILGNDRREVTLRTENERLVLEDRWASFGWRVTSVRSDIDDHIPQSVAA